MKKRFRRLYILGSVAAVALSSTYILPVSGASVYEGAVSQDGRKSIDKDVLKVVDRLGDRDKQALKRIIDTMDKVKDYHLRVYVTPTGGAKFHFGTPISYETFKVFGIDGVKDLTLKVVGDEKEEARRKLKEAFKILPSLAVKCHWVGETCKMKNLASNEISLVNNIISSIDSDEIKVFEYGMPTYLSHSARNAFGEELGASVTQALNNPEIIVRLRTILAAQRLGGGEPGSPLDTPKV